MEKLRGLGSSVAVGRGITRRDFLAIVFIGENWVRLVIFTAELLVKIVKTKRRTTKDAFADPVGVVLMASDSKKRQQKDIEAAKGFLKEHKLRRRREL